MYYAICESRELVPKKWKDTSSISYNVINMKKSQNA